MKANAKQAKKVLRAIGIDATATWSQHGRLLMETETLSMKAIRAKAQELKDVLGFKDVFDQTNWGAKQVVVKSGHRAVVFTRYNGCPAMHIEFQDGAALVF
ncbi:hypothetical protein [Achromobacter phage Motura]|uniref:Uncharacterized protein n=1 Tax=Achromobacter phage Motura TaxID=2591403 RepID=A0A514CSN5_9CAUD|nr:hypothetical protein H1O15_gp318 [Achromobacter phage Motura]QDH83488.1 hypothetical protein [Achromobacter phage Motura]